jgi:hypothetical protein
MARGLDWVLTDKVSCEKKQPSQIVPGTVASATIDGFVFLISQNGEDKEQFKLINIFHVLIHNPPIQRDLFTKLSKFGRVVADISNVPFLRDDQNKIKK